MAYTGAAGSNDGNWKGGGNTGLTTTNTWAGNTAYGPAGGMATGYATRDVNSLANAGMKPTAGYYSNFNNLNGTPMFGGALSGLGGYGMNAQQGFSGALRDYQSALNASFDKYGAQLSGAQPTGAPVVSTPLPAVNPPIPNMRPPSQNMQMPQLPSWSGGMPVGYDSLRAAISPNYSRTTVRMGGNYNNPQLGSAARGTLGNYANPGMSGWSYGGNSSISYNR